MKRRLFNVLAGVSLVLCVATIAIWVRSYRSLEIFGRYETRLRIEIASARGVVLIDVSPHEKYEDDIYLHYKHDHLRLLSGDKGINSWRPMVEQDRFRGEFRSPKRSSVGSHHYTGGAVLVAVCRSADAVDRGDKALGVAPKPYKAGLMRRLRLRPTRHAGPLPGMRHGAGKQADGFKLTHDPVRELVRLGG